MNIVLVCLTNFQPYILTNIEQLIKLNHNKIFIITNFYLFHFFENYKLQINLINADELNDSYKFENTTTLNRDFRNGFWMLTSLRLFYVYEFMKKYNVDDVIHLENDVVIYYNCEELNNYFNKNYIYIPFDSYNRNIASIMYIPNKDIFKETLDNYDNNKNDMENFAYIQKTTNLIQNLPIFIKNEELTDEQKFVCNNSDIFPFIFDAAAMGQYLGGVDPRNDSNNTIGFINETCVIKYNNNKIWFEEIHGIKKPFILIREQKIPIFNLHIHSKNLVNFV